METPSFLQSNGGIFFYNNYFIHITCFCLLYNIVCYFFLVFLQNSIKLNCIIHLKYLFFTHTEPNYLKLCLKHKPK